MPPDPEMEHLELIQKLRDAPEADRWEWLANTLRTGNRRISSVEEKCKSCKPWHEKVLKFLLGLVIAGAGAAFLYLMGLVGRHVFGQ